MNKCHFLGRLTRDPELKNVGTTMVLNFDIAINRRYKRGEEWINEPSFIPCEAWDSGAETIAKHLKKGDPVIVHGALKTETWEDKNSGQKRSKLKLRVENFDFVPANSRNAPSETTAPATADTGDDPIPF